MADKITSPDQLKALAQKAKADIDLREGRKETQVTVHMGTCGIAAGARDIVAAFMTELSANGVTSASLHQSGCAGLCEQEPMATVTLAGGATYRYGLLDKDKVHTIVVNHLVGGTTEDRQFSLEIGRCFGACGLAPVIMVDDDVHHRVKPKRVNEILAQYAEEPVLAGSERSA